MKINSQAKLTREDVEQIRQLAERKESEIKRIISIAGHKALAEKFGVSPTCIGHVVTYRTW